MYSKKHFLIVIFAFIFLNFISGANPYCTNLGFELKNFTNWTGYTWVDGQPGYVTSLPKVEGIVDGRHTIITSNGYDNIVGGSLLKLIPLGYNQSVKLGTTALGKGGLRQSLSYQLEVSEKNALVLYRFAVVLQDPNNSTHDKIDEPRFKVSILDDEGNEITDCANYDVYASDAQIEGWQTITYENAPLYWRDWTAVGIDLTRYIGRKINIEFLSANCRRRGHFGYAYFVAECQPLNITVDYCKGDKQAVLNAPNGFESYEWKNSKSVTVETNQRLTLSNPSEGDTYSCKLLSATGCEVTLNTTIYRYEPDAEFSHSFVNCNDQNNSISFFINNSPLHGTIDYTWNFHEGADSISNAQNPVHNFKSVSGWVPVTLYAKNPPSSCVDTYTTMVETFYPPLISIQGDTTYCPGKTTTLKGYGADHYVWKLNGDTISNADSVTVGAPGGLLELTGFTSKEECSAIKYKTIIEEPYWDFSATSDTYFCKYKNVVLNAKGALTYRWSESNSTSPSLTVNKPGIYTVTGTNKRGCEKSISINVREIDLPKTGFTVMPELIDSRHNEIQCFVPQEVDVNYYWDFGDGEKDSLKNAVRHNFTGLTQINELKTITLRAINTYGCDSVAQRSVTVGPFFPNVFTPNTDGINDKFLKGIDVIISDRYGQVIYKGNEGWNGKFGNSGSDLPPDTYFYYATYTNPYGEFKTRKGFVTLIR